MAQPVIDMRERARMALLKSRQPAAPRPAVSTVGTGWICGSRVVTPGGWAVVERLRVGDEVLTFDCGFQRITATVVCTINDDSTAIHNSLWPLFIPRGTLDNRQDLVVQPLQGVLIESRSVRDKWGDPYALIPGAAFEQVAGVRRIKPEIPFKAVLPVFAEDQMVFTNGGALLFSQCAWGIRAGVPPRFGRAPNYEMMSLQAAGDLLASGAVETLRPAVQTQRLAA